MILGLSHIIYNCDLINFQTIKNNLLTLGYYIEFEEKDIDNYFLKDLLYDKNNITSNMVFFKKKNFPSIEIIVYGNVLKQKPNYKFEETSNTIFVNTDSKNIICNFYSILGLKSIETNNTLNIHIKSLAPSMNINLCYKNNLSFTHQKNYYLDNLGINSISLLSSNVREEYEKLQSLNLYCTQIVTKFINGKMLEIFFTKNKNEIIEFISYKK